MITRDMRRLYRLMLSGNCYARITRRYDDENKYVFEIRRYWSWDEVRDLKNVVQFYYATFTSDGVIVEAEEIEK